MTNNIALPAPVLPGECAYLINQADSQSVANTSGESAPDERKALFVRDSARAAIISSSSLWPATTRTLPIVLCDERRHLPNRSYFVVYADAPLVDTVFTSAPGCGHGSESCHGFMDT